MARLSFEGGIRGHRRRLWFGTGNRHSEAEHDPLDIRNVCGLDEFDGVFHLPRLSQHILCLAKDICTKFIITNQRVKLETGIIFRRIDEVELYRIKDVKVDYSLLNQAFNIGTITLRSSDPTTRDHALTIPYVFDARKVRETLRNAIEQSRRRRGVREVDIEPMTYVV